jgi:hypothetical protein
VRIIREVLATYGEVKAAKLRQRTDTRAGLEGRRQLELALLLDDLPHDREQLPEARTLLRALTPALLQRTGITASVTGAGGVGIFDRYGITVYERD